MKIEDIENHAKRLEQTAREMLAAGIGSDPAHGHASTLIAMAGDLRAQAALGRKPTTLAALSAVADAGEAARHSKMPGRAMTLLEAVNAAADDQTGLQALVNLRARAERAGYSIPDDAVIRLADLDNAIARAPLNERWALKADMHRAGILAA